MKRFKLITRIVCGGFYAFAGITHFAQPEFYLNIMPPYILFHGAMVALSGVAEIVLGVALIAPKTSRFAGWGIIALLIAIFPANIHLFLNQELMEASPAVHLLRLPMQGVLALWAYWYTRPEDGDAATQQAEEAG